MAFELEWSLQAGGSALSWSELQAVHTGVRAAALRSRFSRSALFLLSELLKKTPAWHIGPKIQLGVESGHVRRFAPAL